MTDHDRDRSAITGRFVTDEFADENPDTTVSEHVPAKRRCHAPDEMCVNTARCGRFDKCCWESEEALSTP